MGPFPRSFIIYMQIFEILRKNLNSRMLWFQAFWVEEVHLCATGGILCITTEDSWCLSISAIGRRYFHFFLVAEPFWMVAALLKQTPHRE